MVKRLGFTLGLILFSSSLAAGQTPNTLRIRVDANNSIVSAGTAQVSPITTCLFSNCRLAVDASGNLLVVVAGGIFTSPLFGPTQTDCSVVTYSFTGRTTTGLNSHAANTWNLCGGGTLGLSGNTTSITSSLQFLNADGSAAAPSDSFANRTDTGRYRSTTLMGLGNSLVNSVNSTPSFLNYGSGIILPSTSCYTWSNGALTDGGAVDSFLCRNGAGVLTITGTTPTIQLGGTTSSFPALKRSGTGFHLRLADDSAYTQATGTYATAGTITAVSNTSANSCGTTAAVISTGSNDNSGSFTVGATSGTSCTLTFNVAATNRRDCVANNETTANLARVVYVNTTTSKVEGTFNGADIVSYICFAR